MPSGNVGRSCRRPRAAAGPAVGYCSERDGRVLFDLLVLIGLGLLLAASLAVVFATTAVAGRLVTAAGAGATPARWLSGTIGFLLGVGVNTLLSIAVLTALPLPGS
jgi:hypothetical protein